MAILGIDVGTSSTKAVAIDELGRVRASASAPHAIAHPRDGWSEQDPRWWWASTVSAVRDVLAHPSLRSDPVKAVGLSGQMHGSVFLSEAALARGGCDVPALRPALLWNDQRTADQCREIERVVGGRAALVRMVGNAALTGFQAPKVLWLRDHEPELFRQLAAVLLPKDYIRFCLTGTLAGDVGDCSGTLLFDIEKRDYAQGLMSALGLNRAWFPKAHESAAITGAITPEASRVTGLPAGIPVVAGSGDNMAGAVGAGIVEPGLVLATLGTSGVIYAPTHTPRPDAGSPVCGRTHAMCAGDGDARRPGGWCVTGVTLSAAGSLAWFRDTCAPGMSFEDVLREAAAVPPGCEGLVFLSQLTGERCPHPDPLARGAFVGLTARHTRAHLARAVIEGVTFTMAQILELVRSLGVPVERVRLGGGGAKSPLWRQLQADLYGLPVEVPTTEEGPAYGVALHAGVGVGVWPGVSEACRACLTVTDRHDPADARPYAKARAVHAALYDDLKVRFAQLA